MKSICEENEHKNDVLFVTLAAQGHLNPTLRLAVRLVSRGLHVTLATNHYALKHHHSSATNSIGGVHLHFFSDGLPIDYDRKSNHDRYFNSIKEFGSINLLALIRSHPRKFACIIHNPFVPWVADVAAEAGVPTAMLWIQPSTLYQIYHHYFNHLVDFPTESNPNICVKLPGLPVFSAEDLPSFVLPSNTPDLVHDMLKEVFHNMHKVKWLLVNSFMEIEEDVIKSLNNSGRSFWPVGPIVPATLYGKGEVASFDLFKQDGKSNCLKWLDTQNPSSVVYISFGSLLFLSQKETESIAIGLKKTNRPFIWVIKSPENQQVPELGILEEIKEQGLIVNWSPQTSVLSHPSVGCFLSHCGWNSLLESVAAGVPVIAYPQWTDQPTNAKLVTDVWGVGVKMKKNSDGVLTGEEVGRCIEEVMRSEGFRRKASELKTAAREAMADGGASDKYIHFFVNEIMS